MLRRWARPACCRRASRKLPRNAAPATKNTMISRLRARARRLGSSSRESNAPNLGFRQRGDHPHAVSVPSSGHQRTWSSDARGARGRTRIPEATTSRIRKTNAASPVRPATWGQAIHDLPENRGFPLQTLGVYRVSLGRRRKDHGDHAVRRASSEQSHATCWSLAPSPAKAESTLVGADDIASAFDDDLWSTRRDLGFKAKGGEVAQLPSMDRVSARSIAVVGLGKRDPRRHIDLAACSSRGRTEALAALDRRNHASRGHRRRCRRLRGQRRFPARLLPLRRHKSGPSSRPSNRCSLIGATRSGRAREVSW